MAQSLTPDESRRRETLGGGSVTVSFPPSELPGPGLLRPHQWILGRKGTPSPPTPHLHADIGFMLRPSWVSSLI